MEVVIMIVPREFQEYPKFEVPCPGGTLHVTFLDRDKVYIETHNQRHYDFGMRGKGRNYTTTGCYIVNGVEHIVEATYIHVFGNAVRGYWYSHIDGEDTPADLWVIDKSEDGLAWRREDYYSTHKWVSDAAYKRLKAEVYECLRYALSAFEDQLDEAHNTHLWNALRDLELEVQKHEQEIEKLYASMNDIV